MKKSNKILMFVMGFWLATVLSLVIQPILLQPNCPTEDSCRADYYGGKYHIVQVVP